MLAQRKEIPSLQSDFYCQQFHKMLRWLMVTIGIMFILIMVTLYLVFFQPQQQYYANTSDGKILNMPPAIK